MHHRSPLLLPILTVCALAAGGCGLAPASRGGATRLTITRDFGSRQIGTRTQRRIGSAETAERLLQRYYPVTVGPGGRTVESIAGAASARTLSWSVWVNGIAPLQDAGRVPIHAGDRIWWDLHDSSGASQIPAVVGSYPEPFTSGSGGRRLPTVLTCAAGVGRACNTVARALTRAGIKVARGALGSGSGSDSLAILVGTFSQLRGVIAAELIAAGPSRSGVYAQFAGAGADQLELYNPQGQVVRVLGAGAGLVAATEEPSLNEPAWLVTGTDPAGVAAAAGALSPGTLDNHLAVAVATGRYLPLPLAPLR